MTEQARVKASPVCSILNFSPFSVSVGDGGCSANSSTHIGIQGDLFFPLFICYREIGGWALSMLQILKSFCFFNSAFSMNRFKEASMVRHCKHLVGYLIIMISTSSML